MRTRLAGLSLEVGPDSLFVNVGTHQRYRQPPVARRSARTATTALAAARQQVDNGAQMIDINMDEGLLILPPWAVSCAWWPVSLTSVVCP